ncbi:hypothetical protein EJ05DRAFT_498512 [Pseudovirgaria hyperparasitica]|uniref:GET complex, subunit GET2 n=1 Tax=Pseudovirgaria hyperparasitica TaxID=470096 RepID=A0A6A6WCX3_9PEZI|nr:uncharacterized protein EJ05DRAFT_498512 [Pseudovirgaria hyperparasitica]KAF2760553.1 hypothetical protein EJ05DRAFT_498512 [Pseudovirgaria hyperparasitica]
MAEPIPADETPNQKQARLRRERRNAKIQAGGSARLAAITSMSGRPAPAPDDAPAASTTPSKSTQVLQHSISHDDDPDEVDISQHHYIPRTTSRPLTPSGRSSPFTGSVNAPGAQDDPQMRMLQQMLGGFDPNAAGGAGAGGDPLAGLPPGMQQMMAAMTGGTGMGGPQETAPVPTTTYVWRIVHAVFALGLAVYIASQTAFTGAKSARRSAQNDGGFGLDDFELVNDVGKRLFWLFATAEVVLQSSRYFLERGALPQSGIFGMLSSVLPEPFSGYVRVVGRYSVIYTTVVADAMVVVFVLGCVAWWRGGIA